MQKNVAEYEAQEFFTTLCKPTILIYRACVMLSCARFFLVRYTFLAPNRLNAALFRERNFRARDRNWSTVLSDGIVCQIY